jgi:catechol 2,3-dioxygenase-like lactoylglutathione lyase family enzyme
MPDVPIDDGLPDSPIHTTGTDHVTIWGSNAETVLGFYRDLLGMRVVLRQPNLDDPDQTHLFLDTGDGRILTFFVSDDRPANRGPQPTGTGAVHHLAFRVDPERFEEVKTALEADGRGYNEFDRGIFHSLYTRDNDGLIVELAADKYSIPDDRRADALAAAQRHREADGAEYAKEEHMEAALEELGLPVEPYDLSEADSGVGGVE